MKIIVTCSTRFVRAADGTFWSPSHTFGYNFWTRYLDVFEEVRLVSRIKDVKRYPENMVRMDGPGVVPEPLPYYEGAVDYMKVAGKINRRMGRIINSNDVVLLRLPDLVSNHAWLRCRNRRPVFVELVGDPYDGLSRKSQPIAGGLIVRNLYKWLTQLQCRDVDGVAYVTQEALQIRYPTRSGALSVHYSSIALDDEWLAATPRSSLRKNLVTVGSLEHMYKAVDILLQAFAKFTERLSNGVSLTVVGGGRHEKAMRSLARKLGVAGKVRFTGHVHNKNDLREILDSADLFVLPSRQEGVPRAMIEAMARALPCIGSTIGGIPELLPAEDMVPPEDATTLADRILEVLKNPVRMQNMSGRNLKKAAEYTGNVLAKRRGAFYTHAMEETKKWQRARKDYGVTF